MAELLSSKIVRARKDHRCDWCFEKITKGIEYRNAGLVNDGQVYTWKNHVYCDLIVEKLKMYEDYPDGVSESDFSESITSEYFDLNIIDGKQTAPKNPEFRDMLDFVLQKYGISK